MKNNIIKLERSDDLILRLPEGWAEEGEKVSIREENRNIIIEKLVNVEIDIDDQTFLNIAKMAHENDLTFNEMCRIILEEKLRESE